MPAPSIIPKHTPSKQPTSTPWVTTDHSASDTDDTTTYPIIRDFREPAQARFNPSSLQLLGKSKGAVLVPHPVEIPSRRPRVCGLDGDMVHFAGCACLFVRDVVWGWSYANLVQNCFKRVFHFSLLA